MLNNETEISLKSTKKEMLAAYNTLLAKLEEKKEKELKPEEKIMEKKKAKVIKLADSLSVDGVVNDINNIKLEIGKMLGKLSDSLEEEVEKYKGIHEAIAIKEEELKEIYEIEKSASSLAALIEAQHIEKQKFEDEMRTEKEKLHKESTAVRAEWESEKKQYEDKIKEQNLIESKKHEREKEEYKYAFEREKQLARDSFEYEKKQLEKNLKIAKEESEKELAEREQLIAESEKELVELRNKAKAFPMQMEAAVKKGIKEATDKLILEAQYKEDLLKKEFEGEKNVFNTRIASLESLVKEQASQISKLSQQLEQAYQKIQDTSLKAIEGASKLGSFSSLHQFLSEQSRKQTQDK